jgi:hypothetical protein
MISELALKDRKTNTIILMHGLEKRLSLHLSRLRDNKIIILLLCFTFLRPLKPSNYSKQFQ